MIQDGFPLMGILLVTLTVVLAAIEMGYRTGRWRLEKLGGKNESEAQLSAMTGAHLALLAFIMAFSFNMAAGHFQERRSLIQDDANALGTAYLRADLISAPEAAAIQALLIEYTAERARIRSVNEANHLLKRTDELQAEMWKEAKSLTEQQTPNVLHSLLIQSLNEVFDVHEERVAAGLKHRVPYSLWLALGALLTLAMLGIGYFSGLKGQRNPIASTVLALSFSLVLLLIADLDRPTGGMVRADQSAMSDLLEKLQQSK
ncbi:MAG: hypothetical protein ABJN62_14865 [Halioglobus sp.]